METKYQLPEKFCNQLERKTFWAELFINQAASGLSAKKFCKLYQIPYSTYKGNRYKVEPKVKTQQGGIAKNKISAMQHNNHVAKFLPLQITANDVINQNTNPTMIDQGKPITTTYDTTSEIQIIFKNGHRLILPVTISEVQLLSIINSVASLLC
jgi:formylmethanofuran dehydrogenase subunit D